MRKVLLEDNQQVSVFSFEGIAKECQFNTKVECKQASIHKIVKSMEDGTS